VKPERLLPFILLMAGAAVLFYVYNKKTTVAAVPASYLGHEAVELFYRHECITCHWVTSLPDARGTLGPGLDDVGNRALEYDPEHNGEEYLRESILTPSKVVRPGFINGMPSFKGKLTDAEVEILVSWLKLQKQAKGR